MTKVKHIGTEFVPPEVRELFQKWERCQEKWEQVILCNIHLICEALESGKPFRLDAKSIPSAEGEILGIEIVYLPEYAHPNCRSVLPNLS